MTRCLRRIRQWLKTLRKKNVSVILRRAWRTSRIRASRRHHRGCASRIFLPNPQATEPQIRTIYEGFGLNSRQIEIVATAAKRDYYYQSRLGNRLFDLDLGPRPGLRGCVHAARPARHRRGARCRHHLHIFRFHPFAATWLRHRGLHWAAELLSSFPSTAGELTMKTRILPAAIAAVLTGSLMFAQPAAASSCSIRPTSCRTC